MKGCKTNYYFYKIYDESQFVILEIVLGAKSNRAKSIQVQMMVLEKASMGPWLQIL